MMWNLQVQIYKLRIYKLPKLEVISFHNREADLNSKKDHNQMQKVHHKQAIMVHIICHQKAEKMAKPIEIRAIAKQEKSKED